MVETQQPGVALRGGAVQGRFPEGGALRGRGLGFDRLDGLRGDLGGAVGVVGLGEKVGVGQSPGLRRGDLPAWAFCCLDHAGAQHGFGGGDFLNGALQHEHVECAVDGHGQADVVDGAAEQFLAQQNVLLGLAQGPALIAYSGRCGVVRGMAQERG